MSCLSDADCLRILSGESPIKIWRERLGMSREELSQGSRVHRNALERVEAGSQRLTDREISRVATALGLHPLALIGLEAHTSCCNDCQSREGEEGDRRTLRTGDSI